MRFPAALRSRPAVHLLFWAAFYALYLKLGMDTYASWEAVSLIYLGKILVQAVAAYVLVYLLIPKLLNPGKYLQFGLALLIWTYVVYILLVISRAAYLEPAFIDYFRHSERHVPVLKESVSSRLRNLNAYLDAIPWLFTPAAFMGLVKFYRTQLRLLTISEEKKRVELQLLKAQLNPHFLFNTLNNLYALALKKDDRAPGAIFMLSEILDFLLYRCQGDFISLKDAITLLEHFIALENLRYGERRLQVVFSRDYDQDYNVPLLIFLTLLENAFKHGVANEPGKALITIVLSAKDRKISFCIENSKPGIAARERPRAGNIGLQNIRQQLALLYPSQHELAIDNRPKSFCVNLVLYDN